MISWLLDLVGRNSRREDAVDDVAPVALARPVPDPSMPVLFLDFDGVLHRRQNGSFEYAQDFESAVLMSGMDIQIVISSNWRTGATLDWLRSHFSPAFRPAIVGMTMELASGSRMDEIRHYCARHRLTTWLAVDDDDSILAAPPGRAFLTQYDTGLAPHVMPEFCAALVIAFGDQ